MVISTFDVPALFSTRCNASIIAASISGRVDIVLTVTLSERNPSSDCTTVPAKTRMSQRQFFLLLRFLLLFYEGE